MCNNLHASPVPFLAEALNLDDLPKFESNLSKIMELEGIALCQSDPHHTTVTNILHQRGWYRGSSQIVVKVSTIYLYWYDNLHSLDAILEHFKQYYPLMGDNGLKLFNHLQCLYTDFEKITQR